MNLNYQHVLVRWASAAMVATGAITFVAADGHAVIKRLFIDLVASGAGGVCSGVRGTAYGYATNHAPYCDVGVAAAAGTTNSGNALCPATQGGGPLGWIHVTLQDDTTGWFWETDPYFVAWGNTVSQTQTTPRGCQVQVSAHGN